MIEKPLIFVTATVISPAAACPACRGSGRDSSVGRRYLLAVGRRVHGASSVKLARPPPCRACQGSGRLVDVLIR